ncbi:hypothetical protein FOCC_FOCC011584, partial [Frankliniella occidentalis]
MPTEMTSHQLHSTHSSIMPNPRQTYYSADWEDDPNLIQIIKYIKPVPPSPASTERRPTAVLCTLCQKTLHLGNMGKRAVTGHAKTTTHQKAVERRQSNLGIKMFATSSTASAAPK